MVMSIRNSYWGTLINSLKQALDWKKRRYLDHSPQFIKQEVFLARAVSGAPWVETGTYLGTTTDFLARKYPLVHTIEPAKLFYEKAKKTFHGRNVNVILGSSEHVFPNLLPTLRGDLNFWLDGHYSSGMTFKGKTDCPIEDELPAISANLRNFGKVCILIDDLRLFVTDSAEYADYPSIDFLVDWARAHSFRWRVEHDIFVMQNF